MRNTTPSDSLGSELNPGRRDVDRFKLHIGKETWVELRIDKMKWEGIGMTGSDLHIPGHPIFFILVIGPLSITFSMTSQSAVPHGICIDWLFIFSSKSSCSSR